MFTNLVILGFTLKSGVYKIQNAENIFSASTTDCSKQVPKYEDVTASKQTERKHHDMANLSPLLKQNHPASFRDPSQYLSAKLCVYECMHMFGTVVQDLGKNIHVFNKENVHLPFGLYSN